MNCVASSTAAPSAATWKASRVRGTNATARASADHRDLHDA